MSSSPSRLTLRQLSCWFQVILLAWGMGGMVQPVTGSQVLPRLETETVTDPEQGTTVTAYAYDAANNRASKTVQGGSEPGFWQYDYNAANQLVSWRKLAGPWGTLLKEATLGYDANGNRSEQRVADVATLTAAVTQYSWDAQDRLIAVEMPDGQVHGYEYDYRTRRMGISRAGGAQGGPGMATAVVFSGGLSLAEWESTATTDPSSLIPDPSSPIVHYTRGPDMGGGVGGLLYSRRGETLKYNLSNGRGDIVAQGNAQGELTWTASYEAYGKRTKETGENADKQRANTKDEDPTGLLNEGFRYRDLETGVWLSRDPAGFVDGPNLYAYVKQNPWTGWDPDGLATDQDQAMDFEGGGGRGSFITGGSDNRSLDLRYFVRPVQPQSSNSRATTSPKPASTNSPKPNAGPDQVQPKTNTTATEPAPAARGSNNTVTNSAAKTGQEAHRQTQKELREQGYQTKVPVTLKNGQQVRKDAIKDNEAVIIKPDTATGRKAAEAREKLLKEQSNLEPKTKLYDPQDPKFQPGSPTFIGPKPKSAKKAEPPPEQAR